jgi:hypothetical protein
MATISKNGIEPGKLIKSEHLVRIINALAASSSADIEVSGSVSSSLFYGDGRYLSNVTASNLGTLIAAVQPWHVPYLDGNGNTFQNSTIHVTSSLVNGVQVFYVAINTTASFEVESRAPEALLVYQDNPDSYSVIRGEGVVDNYFEIEVKNFNTGSSASSDLVATANNGTESDMYVNVGINNEGYDVEGSLGGPNDVYIYGLGQKMVIGNARSGDSGSVTIFAGGFDTEIYRKMVIDPNNRHNITGSLTISESLDVKQGGKITGSFGILGAITASNLPGFSVSSSFIPHLEEDFIFRNSALYQSSSLVGGQQVAFVIINGTGSRDLSAPEALFVRQNDPGSYNLIAAEGRANSYAQINIININSGAGASADVVATNDIGTESEYYIDMGINSSNYNVPNVIGIANDAYLYSTGRHLHIGNASPDQPLGFFAGGFDAEFADLKMVLNPNNNHILTGSLNMSGSLDVKKDVKVSGSLYLLGESLYINGQKQFNYGAFSDTTTQSGSANISSSFKFNTVDFSNNISIANNDGGFPTRITPVYGGIYNLQFSAQVSDEGPGNSNIWIWLKKNGENVANTATRIYVRHNEETVAAWNFVVDSTPGDYLELAWQSDDTDVLILAESAAGNIPAIPSIILTVTQVS